MPSRSLTVRLSVWLALAACAQACAQTPEQPRAAAATGDCSSRVVVGFRAPPDSDAIAALATSHALTLAIVDRLLPDLYVLDLGTHGDALACGAAVERLRADARVRSVELDARRAPHAGD